MWAYQLSAAVSKETRIILRDKHALMILFVMPVAFVLIMSLALRDAFSERAGISFSLVIVDLDGGSVAAELSQAFEDSRFFSVERRAADSSATRDEAGLRAELDAGRYKFALWIPPGASAAARARVERSLGLTTKPKADDQAVHIRVLTDPTVRRDHRALMIAEVNQALRAVEAGLLRERFGEFAKRLPGAAARAQREQPALTVFEPVVDEFERERGDAAPTPTSVQQNAPAWTLFAMFFLVIPLSVTLIKERQEGSLTRLRAMPVPAGIILGGKVIPYFVINQIQVALILWVSIDILPMLGGDALAIGRAPGGIVLLSVSASLAAIGYGLVVASFARTPEQATTFGGISVLILAAIGGILVPKLVMPAALLQLAAFSPLSWGLDGFLALFVRNAGAMDVLPEAYKLLGFALLCFGLAVWRFQRGFRSA